MRNATAVERLGHKFRLFTIQMAANEALMNSPASCLLLDMKWVNPWILWAMTHGIKHI